jgi:hypothetical protein
LLNFYRYLLVTIISIFTITSFAGERELFIHYNYKGGFSFLISEVIVYADGLVETKFTDSNTSDLKHSFTLNKSELDRLNFFF